ncbi:VOC family protein [Deinococcus pimensis]|uniref:VOC family protein n=1 Tax=Deinococcus pimensis TaxID=309888 RepID=UPI000693E79C|nr:VOC family protein [Deinococcus pimensis]
MNTSDPASRSRPQGRIDAQLSLGEVALTVADLDGAVRFYTLALGLHEVARDSSRALLGTPEGRVLVALRHVPDALEAPANATGLYHLAVALPGRADLARWLRHAAAMGLRLGQSDHRTHEAFYLDDPEGNGIEVYHDWPRERWPFRDGRYTSFDSAAIDIPDLLGTLAPDDAGWTGVPNGTRMGHVHLRMRDAGETRAFYEDVMGFGITADGMGAVFAAAGGYHHHLGHNLWHSRGGPVPPEGARGLRHYAVELTSEAELGAVAGRLQGAGIEVRGHPEERVVRDPAGNTVRLRVGRASVESILEALAEDRRA